MTFDFLVEFATLQISQIYSKISPLNFVEPSYEVGRPLNLNEEDEVASEFEKADGNRIVYLNEIISDAQGNQFRVIDEIGNGTYSYVYKVLHLSTQQLYAMKVMKRQKPYFDSGMAEITIFEHLARFQHPGKEFTLQAVCHFILEEHVCIVLPLCYRSLFLGLGSLASSPLGLEQIRIISRQLLLSVDFFHQHRLIHCDVKTDNIMFVSKK